MCAHFCRFNVATFGGAIQFWQADLTVATKDVLVSLGNWLSSVCCCGNTRLLEAMQVSAKAPTYDLDNVTLCPPPRLLWTVFPHPLCMWYQTVGWTTVRSSSSGASEACGPQPCTLPPSTVGTGGCGPRCGVGITPLCLCMSLMTVCESIGCLLCPTSTAQAALLFSEGAGRAHQWPVSLRSQLALLPLCRYDWLLLTQPPSAADTMSTQRH